MSILGSLIVTLSANTASFVEGLNGASKTARTVGREIEGSFSQLGNVAASALAPFGAIGSAVAMTLGQVGEAAGGAIQNFGKLGGAIGAVSAVGAGAAAAMGAVSLGAIGLAMHTAESIAKMGELSQSTGVSVKALSGLSFVGKQVGVDTETMAKSLEKMDKAVFAAATAPANATNAFTRLHIALRDSAGQIRPTQDIFADLAGKFAAMPDGVTKTALAMQAFSKSGAGMIPVLNLGKDGIKDLLDTAQALGVVLDEQTVQAAEKFKASLATIDAAGQGLSIRLTKDLLPALQTVATSLVDGLKDKNSGLNDVIAAVGWLAKAFLATGETIFAILKQIGVYIGDQLALWVELGMGVYNAMARAAHFDWSGTVSAFKDAHDRMAAIEKKQADDSAKIWSDNSKFISGVFGGLAPATARPKGGTSVDTKPGKEDTTLARIQERIKALAQETADWMNLASAGSQAEALIAEAVKKGNAEFGKLRDEAAKDKTGASLPFVMKNEEMIKAAGAASVYGAAIKVVLGDLDKQGIKFGEQAKDALALASAYQQGGAAIAKAAIDKQLEKETQEAGKLADTYADLKAKSDAYIAGKARLGGAAGPVQGENVSPATLGMVKNGADQAAASLAKLKDEASAFATANLSAELGKQSSQFATLKPYVDALNNSYLKSEDAIRAARIELELYQWEQDQLTKGIVVSQTQITQKRTILAEADREAYESSIKQSAAQYDLNRLYDEQIVKLQRVREVLQQSGDSTLLIDAKLFNANQQLIKQWDDAAMAVGTFGEKSRAVFNEIVLQGQDAGKKISQAFLSAYDSLTGALAKLATGQKADFKQIFQSLSEQIMKAEIQKGIGSIAEHFGFGNIPGLTAKPDGSTESRALWVQTTKAGALGKSSDSTGVLGGIFGGKKADGSQANPFYVITASSGGGLFGGGGDSSPFAGLFGGGSGGNSGGSMGGGGDFSGADFGGFMALGGDLTPGKAYIAGEKGPEIVRGPGTVTPMSKLGGGHKTSVTNNYNGFKDTDMFRRSTAQMVAHQHRTMSIAYARS